MVSTAKNVHTAAAAKGTPTDSHGRPHPLAGHRKCTKRRVRAKHCRDPGRRNIHSYMVLHRVQAGQWGRKRRQAYAWSSGAGSRGEVGRGLGLGPRMAGTGGGADAGCRVAAALHNGGVRRACCVTSCNSCTAGKIGAGSAGRPAGRQATAASPHPRGGRECRSV